MFKNAFNLAVCAIGTGLTVNMVGSAVEDASDPLSTAIYAGLALTGVAIFAAGYKDFSFKSNDNSAPQKLSRLKDLFHATTAFMGANTFGFAQTIGLLTLANNATSVHKIIYPFENYAFQTVAGLALFTLGYGRLLNRNTQQPSAHPPNGPS